VQYNVVNYFSLHPVKLPGHCPELCSYFRWFMIEENSDHVAKIVNKLDADVTSCAWYMV
jgi:hypothetical protein